MQSCTEGRVVSLPKKGEVAPTTVIGIIVKLERHCGPMITSDNSMDGLAKIWRRLNVPDTHWKI